MMSLVSLSELENSLVSDLVESEVDGVVGSNTGVLKVVEVGGRSGISGESVASSLDHVGVILLGESPKEIGRNLHI